VIPSWYDAATGEPSPSRDENAETAGAALFLSRYAEATGDTPHAGLPKTRWLHSDFGVRTASGMILRLSFPVRQAHRIFDTVTGQYPQNTLSMDYGAEACASLSH